MWARLVAAVAGDSFARVLRRRDVVALAFGAMIGWSWIILTGEWIETAGPIGAIAAFLAGGMVIGTIGLTYAELASAMPFAGGEHVYSLRALGPIASFVCTWAIVLGYGSVVAFETVALPTVIDFLVPGFSVGRLWSVAGWDVHASWVGAGALGSLVVTALNVIGVRPAAAFQTAATAVILAGGALLIIGASIHGSAEAGPSFARGLPGVLTVLMMVPFMFVGFDVIPQSAEEVALPYREIGKLLMVSVALAVIWYAAIIASVGVSLDAAELGGAELATAQAAATVWGRRWTANCLALAGAAGIVTSWNAFLIGGSRAIYALAASGMLPASLGRLHPRFRTPHNAVILIGALSCLAPMFGRPALLWLANAGSLAIVLAYAMVALSFLVLRRREPGMDRPFRVRHGVAVGSAALILSLGLGALYVPGGPVGLTWPEEWAIVLGWSLLGAGLFTWARRSRARPAAQ
jgi:APA family basic amino acid/polyamine antiporter